MGEPDEKEEYYSTLGLTPDATFEQVKSRFRELNDAYLKILELSRASAKPGAPTSAVSTDEKSAQHGQRLEPKRQPSTPQQTRTEPIEKIKAWFAKGEIKKETFEKQAKERYNYLKNKPFSELTDAEYEERIHGFDGLKFL